jgi:hypothetical protein
MACEFGDARPTILFFLQLHPSSGSLCQSYYRPDVSCVRFMQSSWIPWFSCKYRHLMADKSSIAALSFMAFSVGPIMPATDTASALLFSILPPQNSRLCIRRSLNGCAQKLPTDVTTDKFYVQLLLPEASWTRSRSTIVKPHISKKQVLKISKIMRQACQRSRLIHPYPGGV